MKTSCSYIFLLAAFLVIGCMDAVCQPTFYIPADGKIFFSGDSATIFSDVINRGKMGIGKTVTLNFKGHKWENNNLAAITDESDNGDGIKGVGGVVRFISGDSTRQQLSGGYNAATSSGPTFYHVKIDNPAGVELEGSNTKVRHELQFVDGVVYLAENVLLIGDGNPGIISGYDSTHFIISDNLRKEGFLLREGITDSNGVVVFPVGTSRNSYTPVGIQNKSALPDNFYANVSDGVQGEVSRPDLSAFGVRKTWQVGKQLRPNSDEVELSLQHLESDEGAVFASNKDSVYVSQLRQNLWDTGSPKKSPTPGTLTSGTFLLQSGVNSRKFNGTISQNSFFTKFTGRRDTGTKTALTFNGYRVNDNLVNVYWKTNPEIYNKLFIVQRRYAYEAEFRNIDTVLSRSVNGRSFIDLHYEIRDVNNYIGISFYRLVLVSDADSLSLSNIIPVAPAPGLIRILLWPNPTTEKFYIGLNPTFKCTRIILWTVRGQRLREIEVAGRTIVEVSSLIPGTYYVTALTAKNEIIITKKVVVVGF